MGVDGVAIVGFQPQDCGCYRAVINTGGTSTGHGALGEVFSAHICQAAQACWQEMSSEGAYCGYRLCVVSPVSERRRLSLVLVAATTAFGRESHFHRHKCCHKIAQVAAGDGIATASTRAAHRGGHHAGSIGMGERIQSVESSALCSASWRWWLLHIQALCRRWLRPPPVACSPRDGAVDSRGCTFLPRVENWDFWVRLNAPFGYSTSTSVPFCLSMPLAVAAPLLPVVAKQVLCGVDGLPGGRRRPAGGLRSAP